MHITKRVINQYVSRLEKLISDAASVLDSQREEETAISKAYRKNADASRRPKTKICMDESLLSEWTIQVEAVLDGLSPNASNGLVRLRKVSRDPSSLIAFVGTLRGIAASLKADDFRTLTERIATELAGDLLSQARTLSGQDETKLAAAAVAGATLESHLRLMCESEGLSLRRENGKPKTMNDLNESLKSSGAIDKSEWRSIQSWLQTRNDAAHGHVEKLNAGAVRMMILGIEEFVSRHPDA